MNNLAKQRWYVGTAKTSHDPETYDNMIKAGMTPVEPLGNNGERRIMSTDEDDGLIANVSCHADFKRGQGHAAKCEKRDRYAALIAASPHLLDALGGLYKAVKGGASLEITAALIEAEKAIAAAQVTP